MIPTRTTDVAVISPAGDATSEHDEIDVSATATMPTPLPLERLSPAAPVLNPMLLPASLRAHLSDVALRLGIPIGAIAVGLLVSLGATIGSTARLQLKRNDVDWTEPANLWGMIIAPSGTMKSPVLHAGVRFVEEADRERRQTFDSERAKRKAKQDVLERQIEGVKRRAQKPLQEAELAPLEEELTKLTEAYQAIQNEAPQAIVKDVTMEKLGIIIAGNPRGVLMVRDELGALLSTMHRAGHEGDRGFYTQAYSTNASDSVHRVGRESVHADPLTLSIVGAIQPSVLADHTRDLAAKRGEDGFFARFQLIGHIDPEDTTFGPDVAKDLAAEAQVKALFQTLDNDALTWVATQPRGSYRVVRLDDAAQEHLDAWRLWHFEYLKTPEIQANGALASFLAKSDGAAARLRLQQHLVDRAAGHPATSVTLEQAQRATGLMTNFIQSAKVLYRTAAHPQAALARRIGDRIVGGKIWDGMTVREVHQQFDTSTTRVDNVRDALQLLTDIHWLRVEERQNPSARPSEIIVLNRALTHPRSAVPSLPS